MPTRTITILCLFQVMGLLAAYLFANWFMKTYEKVDGMWVLHTDWAARLMNFRRWILVWLLIPIGTAALCTKLTRSHRDILWLGQDGLSIAVAATVTVVVFSFSIAAVAVDGPPRAFVPFDH